MLVDERLRPFHKPVTIDCFELRVHSNPDSMHEPSLTLLGDDAVYQRTAAGQRELTDRLSRLSAVEKRFLGAVTGHTPLRVLLDLGLDEPGVSEAILRLATRGLVIWVPNRH